MFQAFTLSLWLAQGYIEYSIAIIILSIISIALTVYDLRQVSLPVGDVLDTLLLLRPQEGFILVPKLSAVLRGERAPPTEGPPFPGTLFCGTPATFPESQAWLHSLSSALVVLWARVAAKKVGLDFSCLLPPWNPIKFHFLVLSS